MTDKQIVEIIYKRLKMFLIELNWLDKNTPEQARALFTTLCFIGDINPGTAICDNMLLELYNDSDVESIDMSYDDFENFMVKLIV